jgi:hypothetical protein
MQSQGGWAIRDGDGTVTGPQYLAMYLRRLLFYVDALAAEPGSGAAGGADASTLWAVLRDGPARTLARMVLEEGADAAAEALGAFAAPRHTYHESGACLCGPTMTSPARRLDLDLDAVVVRASLPPGPGAEPAAAPLAAEAVRYLAGRAPALAALVCLRSGSSGTDGVAASERVLKAMQLVQVRRSAATTGAMRGLTRPRGM